MKRRVSHLATIIAAPFAAAILFGAPAHADPLSGTTTTVEMTTVEMTTVEMPTSGANQSIVVSVQDGAGGIDRDGTNGVVDPDGTNGRITGPLMRATPGVRADAAPASPHARS